jgi:hypothetical protein
MGQYQKHVEDLEADGGHGEEVDGHQLLGVNLEECAEILYNPGTGSGIYFLSAPFARFWLGTTTLALALQDFA